MAGCCSREANEGLQRAQWHAEKERKDQQVRPRTCFPLDVQCTHVSRFLIDLVAAAAVAHESVPICSLLLSPHVPLVYMCAFLSSFSFYCRALSAAAAHFLDLQLVPVWV